MISYPWEYSWRLEEDHAEDEQRREWFKKWQFYSDLLGDESIVTMEAREMHDSFAGNHRRTTTHDLEVSDAYVIPSV